MMNKVNDLANRYDVFVASDNAFQRRTRLLQSLWRTERNFEIGVHKGKNGEIKLGSRLKMPWAKETLNNYLTDTIRSVVQAEVLDLKRVKESYIPNQGYLMTFYQASHSVSIFSESFNRIYL